MDFFTVGIYGNLQMGRKMGSKLWMPQLNNRKMGRKMGSKLWMSRCDGWILTSSIFFSFLMWLDVSDVLCRSSLGANPRGVTDSVVRFSTYGGFSIFALLLLMHYT